MSQLTLAEPRRATQASWQPGPAWQPYAAPSHAGRARRWIARLSWLNLAAVVLVLVLLCVVSERWWLSGVLTYLPRAPYAFPGILLTVGSLFACRNVLWVNLVSLVLVAGPIMGLSVPLGQTFDSSPARLTLRMASGNVQEGKPSLLRLVEEVRRYEPDLVCFQETARGCEALDEQFADWDRIHLGAFFVASKYPLRVIDHCKSSAFDRWTSVLVEVETPAGAILIANTHLMTPRHGATGLTAMSILNGTGVDEFEIHQQLRDLEVSQTREFLTDYADQPLIVAGDFNMPTTSSKFADGWGDFTSAFEAAGTGYGYTSPCNTNRLWPANTPWMRIDHILTNDAWRAEACHIGTRDGSDHRVIFAELSLQ
jgi:endonuclease/exonuclease/phosphatase family metal-dependent hydrolase